MIPHPRSWSLTLHKSLWRGLMAGLSLSFALEACTPPAPRRETPPDPSPLPGSDLSQDARVNWLRSHAIPVRSVNPGDDDFSDLNPLKEMIGDARIVLLGEQTHCDALTFLAKTRLIKFLHSEMDFDVLAWESGIYDVHKAWELIESGEDVTTAVGRGIFPTWTVYEETQELFKYVGEASHTERRLRLSGHGECDPRFPLVRSASLRSGCRARH
jgi:hypothetical protein